MVATLAVGIFMVCGFSLDNTLALEENNGSFEIIADGKKYGSMQSYQESKQKKVQENWGSLESQWRDKRDIGGIEFFFQDTLRHIRHLDLKPDIHSMKTVGIGKQLALDSIELTQSIKELKWQEKANKTYDPFLESYGVISRIGFNTGITKVIEDFQSQINGSIYYKHLLAKDLESVLDQSFANNDYTSNNAQSCFDSKRGLTKGRC